jgi:hypothetical protein
MCPIQQVPVQTEDSSFLVMGTSSNHTPSITVLINNLSIKSSEWLLSPSLPLFPPLFSLQPPFPPPFLTPRCPTLSPTSSSSLLPLVQPTSSPTPASDESTTSSTDTSTRRYFLRSQNREHIGGLASNPTQAEKTGRGKKFFFSKAQKRAIIDLLVGKQVSIERELRARRTLGKWP